ncbi:hypothetical protein GGR58DRAFT_441380 [Xylaria digitata]|nr:hypothetical protein GGR58DRAFT_441380 [Xylaria digitata]
MGDEKVLVDGKKVEGIDTRSDERRANYEHEEIDIQGPPQYSEADATTHWEDNIAQQSPARTSGGNWKRLNENQDETVPTPSGTSMSAAHSTVIGRHAGAETLTVAVKTAHEDGLTPLLAAIKTGDIAAVRHLLEAGADPNEYGVVGVMGVPGWRGRIRGPPPSKIYRTPLQLAAAQGNLPIVKLLMETYHADDSPVAPDGELALRLASENGHGEIVAYLPARRGGGFQRWKTRHGTAMRRAKHAAEGIYDFAEFVAFRVPKFFVWTIPKHAVVLPIAKHVRWLYRHRAELPRLVADALKRSWKALRGFPAEVWEVLREIPGFVKWLARVAAVTIRRSPEAIKIAALWIWNGIRSLAGAVGTVFNRLFSFLHTVLVAVGTFFKNVTLRNVWDGFVAFMHAVGVEGPKRLWSWVRRIPDVTVKMLEALWGWVGELLGWLFWGLARAFIYVPKKMWEILASVFNSVGHGGKEVMIWINPKR